MRRHNGFTLTELVVALIVTGIILSAVVVLADAMATANEVAGDTSEKQARVRYATLRISELIKYCRLICGTPGGDLAIWRADDNGDDQINISELVYIDRGAGQDYLRLCEFSSTDSSAIPLSAIGALSTEWWLVYSATAKYTLVIPQCSNVAFGFDVLPPKSRFVSILFDLVENNVVHRYQINATLRGCAIDLLGDIS